MNLNIKQILKDRPSNNLKIQENCGVGSEEVQLRAKNPESDLQYDQSRKMLSQAKNYT